MKKFGVFLRGKIDPISQPVYLNRRGWAQLLSPEEVITEEIGLVRVNANINKIPKYTNTRQRKTTSMCGEYANIFCPYNYGIMRSRLERKYTLRTKIAWNVLYHIMHDSKVEELISMHMNK